MDKNIIKETMLSLESAALQSAREKYFEYVADARLDRSEPIKSDEQAQAEIASDLSEALDDTLHDHTDKLDKLKEVDFGPKSAVTEGALVRLSHNGPGFRSNRRSARRRDRGIQRAEACDRGGRIARVGRTRVTSRLPGQR